MGTPQVCTGTGVDRPTNTMSLCEDWTSNDWLAWGLGPYLAVSMGYFTTVFLLETTIRMESMQKSLISYGKNLRLTDVDETRGRVASFRLQLWTSGLHLMGPAGIVNACLSALLAPQLVPQRGCADLGLMEVVCGVALMVVVNDFALYWGHRVQHESEFLWTRCHHFHHAIGTPSPVSTVYIDPIDATLQGGLPIIIAILVAKPHPVTACLFVAQRVSENCFNHSGLDCLSADVCFLKCLPLRASVAHHDAHHRFSNYSRNAKNYGEAFWVWDYLFGTLSNTAALRKKPAH